MTKEIKGMMASVVGNAIFGFSFLFSKMALNISEPLVLLCSRFTLGWIAMSLLVVFRVMKLDLKGKPVWIPVVIGLLEPVLYFALENYGVQYTSASLAGMLSSIGPVIATLLGAIFLREKPTWKQWVFMFVSIAGVLLVSTGGGNTGSTLLGIVCLLAAYLLGGVYALLIRGCSDRFTAFEQTYIMTTVAFVSFNIWSAVMYRGELPGMLKEAFSHIEFSSAVVYLGIVANIIGYMLINYSLGSLPMARATVFTSFSTLMSVVAGVVFLHEPFPITSAVAFVLIMLGVWGTNRFHRQEES